MGRSGWRGPGVPVYPHDRPLRGRPLHLAAAHLGRSAAARWRENRFLAITPTHNTTIPKERTAMNIRINSLGLALGLAFSTALVSLCGCAGNRYEQSTGEHIDDKATSMRVKKALGADAEYKYSGVEVKTFKGTTQLSGFVDTD